MRYISILAVLLLMGMGQAQAQGDYYTVNVGTFLEAQQSDFETLQSIGYVYAEDLDGNLHQVYLGGFTEESAASQKLEEVRRSGYSGAQLKSMREQDGEEQLLIQVSTLRVSSAIDWNSYLPLGELYVILKNNTLKVCVGPYADLDAARAALPGVKQRGFADAFIKRINSIYTQKLGYFETGIKEPLIPIEFDETRKPVAATGNPSPVPDNRSMEETFRRSPERPENYDFNPRSSSAGLPNIRGDVKRTSVLELQKVLKSLGVYTGSLDGYYGPATTKAFKRASDQLRELQKYQLLAQYMEDPTEEQADELQAAINRLPQGGDAMRTISSYDNPVAKAYRAYASYRQSGPSNKVNQLMNGALRDAFAGRSTEGLPPFDYRATYAYNDLEQLILHLHYIHAAPGIKYRMPCWLAQQHPQEVARAQTEFARVGSAAYGMQSCDGFINWDEVRTLVAAALDLNPDQQLDEKKLSQAASLRAKLYLTQQALSRALTREVEAWDQLLWTHLTAWGERDVTFKRTVTALRISYYQAQVRLEDYYMDRGFTASEAKGLSLATLRTLVGYHLQRFL